MEINFGDTVPLSTLDWPGKATITVFLRECVFRCPYCQNHELLDTKDIVLLKEIKEKINESLKYIDGVVVSGGEPLIQFDAVKELAKYSKNKDLGLGLHTNGYFPNKLNKLNKEELIDFVSLDIKAPLSNQKKYNEITETEIDLDRIKKSLEYLRNFEIELEITTTLFDKKIGLKEIKEISESLDNEKYVLQQGRTENAYKEEYKKINTIPRTKLIEYAKKLNHRNTYVRTKKEGDVEI